VPPHGSHTTTRGIAVRVRPVYDPQQSNPFEKRYLFRYFIDVTNHSAQPVQLISRYWHIKDADANTHEVHGEGVVGLQPNILPGQTFRYNSFCPLHTPWGTMQGHFVMRSENGDEFNATVARFYLVYRENDPQEASSEQSE
jgi:ApaG protein